MIEKTVHMGDSLEGVVILAVIAVLCIIALRIIGPVKSSDRGKFEGAVFTRRRDIFESFEDYKPDE